MALTRTQVQASATLREILSQPEIWLASLDELRKNCSLHDVLAETGSRNEWLFLGCGTSFYLAEVAAGASPTPSRKRNWT